MSRAVVAVAPDARLEEVAALMTRQRVNRVPVVDAGRVVGILSRADVVRWAAR
jgi:CBS domain-containing protein